MVSHPTRMDGSHGFLILLFLLIALVISCFLLSVDSILLISYSGKTLYNIGSIRYSLSR
jgi:hypothetical protein